MQSKKAAITAVLILIAEVSIRCCLFRILAADRKEEMPQG